MSTSTDAAQILGWLLAASAGTSIIDDLIDHGHPLAAACQCQATAVGIDTVRAIVTRVEQLTPDDGMLVAGAALSGAVPPWKLDPATRLDSPLRSGYMCPGWGKGANAADIIPRSRALADPRAIAAQARLVAEWETVGREPTAKLTVGDGGELEFVLGHALYLVRNTWPKHACDLVSRDVLDPEVALMITLRGAVYLNRESITESGFETVLADAFERQRARTWTISLPPVIV
jgi:hypothetical protein